MSAEEKAPCDVKRRDRSIRLAVMTSLMSKTGGAVLQLVSLPFAARVMGKEEFGLFATVAMTITLIIILELGVGPALTQGISRAAARGDKEMARKYYGTSLLMVTAFSVFGGILLGIVIALVPIPTLFGPEYAGLEDSMLAGLWVGLVLFVLEIIMSHTERVREGYMETNVSNCFMAVGNLFAAVVVVIGILYFPKVWFLLLALFGTNVLFRSLNAVALLRKRPFLLPGAGSLSWDAFRHVLRDGLAFSASYALTVLVEFNFAALLLGRMIGLGAVAVFQAFVSVTLALNGLLVMVTAPIWPAVVDAFVKGDHSWIVRTTRKLYGYTLLLGVGAAAGSVLLGSWFLPIWYGDEFQATPLLFAGWGLFVIANCWRRANHVVVVALGMVVPSAKFTLIECALTLGLAVAGMLLAGPVGLWIGMAFSIFCVSGWAFPLMFWTKIRAKTTEESPDSAPGGAA